MPILPYGGASPKIAPDAFIAEGAMIIGDVTIGEGSSVWFNAVLRGDVGPIVVGRHVNIQDNCTVHTDRGVTTMIGDEVSVAHGAIVHGATLEDHVLVAMNAVVLSRARIGRGSVVGAGAVVGPGEQIPPLSLVLGLPGKVRRHLSEAEGPGEAAARAERYYRLGQSYRAGRV